MAHACHMGGTCSHAVGSSILCSRAVRSEVPMPSAQLALSAQRFRLPSRECRPVFRRHGPVSASIRTCPLPNGENVAYISKPDVAFLYREVYEKQSYLQHGVTLAPGNTVLDVGANIGMFAAFAAQRVGRLGHIFAVEPIPMTCDALRYNMGTMLREGAGLPAKWHSLYPSLSSTINMCM